MAIGEAGKLNASQAVVDAPIRVDFTEDLTDPIIAITSSSGGSSPFSVRIVSTDDTGFSFIIEEWDYLTNATHGTETFNWIAIEKGTHTLPDGRTITAGDTQADGNGSTGVSFGTPLTGTPVVLTSVMSHNDGTTVDSDPLNITSSGFNIRLQEEEVQTGTHGTETIGWIAIETGGANVDGSGVSKRQGGVDENADFVGLGTTFTDGVYVGDTQTINGGDTARLVITGTNSNGVSVKVEEEGSDDNETNHTNEVVGVVGFNLGIIPCFTPGTMIRTSGGLRRVESLKRGDLVLTADNGFQPIRWICNRPLDAAQLSTAPEHRPILIRKNALGPGLPSQDMHVSPQHRMMLTGWKAELMFAEHEILVPAKALINDKDVMVDRSKSDITYIHLLFDRHEVLFANEALTESLHAGQLSKGLIPEAARAELFGIFPELRSYENGYGPTARKTPRTRELYALH
ncbi:Hint domain-containing protein [Halocynthiibacter namhaensis]|uniref:Hint domain-containing protein n=1 Tax=Halocynthiibacter namhaensis TaxID=1290553 RepID=UPI00068B5A1F|nr:Hint domain-containing protein [Halocynthiibacter namhaensis]